MVEFKQCKSLSAVISILDSEDVVSTHSENRLEGRYVDLPEERNLDEIEENLPFAQEEMHVSNNLPKTEEIDVSELVSYFLQNRKCSKFQDSRVLELKGTQEHLSFLSLLTQVNLTM